MQTPRGSPRDFLLTKEIPERPAGFSASRCRVAGCFGPIQCKRSRAGDYTGSNSLVLLESFALQPPGSSTRWVPEMASASGNTKLPRSFRVSASLKSRSGSIFPAPPPPKVSRGDKATFKKNAPGARRRRTPGRHVARCCSNVDLSIGTEINQRATQRSFDPERNSPSNDS